MLGPYWIRIIKNQYAQVWILCSSWRRIINPRFSKASISQIKSMIMNLQGSWCHGINLLFYKTSNSVKNKRPQVTNNKMLIKSPGRGIKRVNMEDFHQLSAEAENCFLWSSNLSLCNCWIQVFTHSHRNLFLFQKETGATFLSGQQIKCSLIL